VVPRGARPRRDLNRPSRILSTLAAATFPIYVLHFPVLLVGLAVLTRIALPWQVEFLLLSAVTYALSWGLYRAVALTGPLLPLIGGKRSRRRGSSA
jgi:peptidoglycan/LPS O-acetylase OafA/YrhL